MCITDCAGMRARTPSPPGFHDPRIGRTIRGVTAARRVLQPCWVQDADRAAVVVDDAAPLKLCRGIGHSNPPHSKHVRQELVREQKLARAHPVLRHEQPPRQPCSQQVPVDARSTRHDTAQRENRVALHRCAEWIIALHFGDERSRLDAKGFALGMHECRGRRPGHAHGRVRAHHAFPADHHHFNRRPVAFRDQGNVARGREINAWNALVLGVESMREPQINNMTNRGELPYVVGRQ